MDKIFYNGTIITMEESTIYHCLHIKDGIILSCGNEEILNEQTKETELIDLQGKCMLPAFIDAHSHISALAQTLSLVLLQETSSFDDIKRKLQEHLQNHSIAKENWLIGFGYDHNSLMEKEHPDKNLLDQVSKEIPIMITHTSGHMGVVNSKGLELLKIDRNSEDPVGGQIGRCQNTKEPNGYLEETAFFTLASVVQEKDQTQLLEQLDQAQKVYLEHGITTVQDGLTKKEDFALLKEMARKDKWIVDVVSYIDLENNHDLIQEAAEYVRKYNHHLKIGGYKIILDGSPQGKTAWMLTPYKNEKTYRGYPSHQDKEVESFIMTSLKERLQLLAHCNGDAASEQLVNSYLNVVQKRHFQDTCRPVMIHAQTVREEQLKKMKKLNMIPSFFVDHVYYWGDIHLQNLGLKRASRISPVKTAIDMGLIYTFHQDTPVIAPDMLHTIWCSVNRKTKNGYLLGENERISPYEALKAVTIHAAYQYFEENKKGSIKPGKNADLVVLSDNPLTVAPDKIKEIEVLETWKDGRLVFQKKSM